MKKIHFKWMHLALLLLAIFLFTTGSVKAQVQTTNLVTPTIVAQPVFCYTWTTNLKIGDRGVGVDALVKALIKEGLITNVSEGQVLGEDFNEKLAAAIVGFQQKYASEILTPNGLSYGTGYVGPSTRAKLNSLYGCTIPIVDTTTQIPNQCYKFNTNLTIGSSGQDVVALQTILKYYGYSTNTNGYFGSLTKEAVMSYQSSKGIPSTGFVGAVTRAKLNDLCNTVVQPVTTITLPFQCPAGYTPPSPWVCPVTTTATSSDPTIATSTDIISANINLVDASSDEVSSGFGPGVGIGNKNPNDWHWKLEIISPQNKKIKSISIKSNTYGDGWSTSYSSSLLGKVLYPIYVLTKAFDNSAYDQQIDIFAGYNRLDLYGQPETSTFTGGTLIIEFTDNTKFTANIPASDIRQPIMISPQTSITITGPNGGIFDNGRSQNIITGWRQYTGDFDYYTVNIVNTVANVGQRISGRISKESTGFSITSGEIQDAVTGLSGKTPAPEQGYYFDVFAIKNEGVGERGVATGRSGTFTIKSSTSSTLSCSSLQQTQQDYYNYCKNQGFENVCFNKSGAYQGCTNNARNDCTLNNVNASSNLLCSVGVTQPTIITSTSEGGTIYPSGNISVPTGSNKTFTFTPDAGYQVSAINLDNNVSLPAASSYTFYNVTGSHVIGVIFSPSSTQSSIIITSPRTGENFKVGDNLHISWDYSVMDGDNNQIIYLSGGGHEEGYKKIIGNYSVGTRSTDYTISVADLPVNPGNSWKVAVCNGLMTSGGSNCGWSGAINITTQNSSASITITSPKNPETWIKGQTYNIEWKQNGLSSTNIYAISAGKKYMIASELNSSIRKYSFTIPTTWPDGSDYKIYVGSGSTYDSTSNYITITTGANNSVSNINTTNITGAVWNAINAWKSKKE